MVEKEKTNKKKWIIFAILLIIIITIIVLIIYNNYKAEGNYTGYQLILTANYGGYGVDGRDLGSGKVTKKYKISENDVFSEPTFGGTWILNATNEDSSSNSYYFNSSRPILTVIKLESNTIQLTIKNKEYVVNYNQELNVSSNTVVYDGINYSYTIKIVKHK